MATLPIFDPTQFGSSAVIDNPFFQRKAGTIYTYGGAAVDDETGELEIERTNTFATRVTTEIAGVTVLVQRDTGYLNGVLMEDTVDWLAQDKAGNVWYLGEVTYAFEYDDEGNYVSTSSVGSWEAGIGGAQPGYLMLADPQLGASYYQEFLQGVAEDEAQIVGLNETIETGMGVFDGVLKTLDTTALEPDVAEFKYYVPGKGLVLEEDIGEDGEVTFSNELLAVRSIGTPQTGHDGAGCGGKSHLRICDLVEGQAVAPDDIVQASAKEFRGHGTDYKVTFLAEHSARDNAIGAYTFDLKTGEIGEARILFAETEDLVAKTSARISVEKGEGLGLFLVPDGGDLGLDLSAFAQGGLFFTNFLSGEAATIHDGLAPLITNAAGDVLPITALHALDGSPGDGLNFLNPTAATQAIELHGKGGKHTKILGFEDLLTTDDAYDGDFNDALLAVREVPRHHHCSPTDHPNAMPAPSNLSNLEIPPEIA